MKSYISICFFTNIKNDKNGQLRLLFYKLAKLLQGLVFDKYAAKGEHTDICYRDTGGRKNFGFIITA